MTRHDARLAACKLGRVWVDRDHCRMEERPDIQFDRWTFRRRPRALLRDGVRVKLQDQSLQILEALLESPGDLVTRERLIARLWPKRIVEFDAALNAAVRRLRATLCDVAETPRYVETVPRQGYRFIGAIRELCDAASASLESPRLPALPAPGPAGVAAQRPPALQRVGVPIAVGAICIALGGAALWAGLATRSQPAMDAATAAAVRDREQMHTGSGRRRGRESHANKGVAGAAKTAAGRRKEAAAAGPARGRAEQPPQTICI